MYEEILTFESDSNFLVLTTGTGKFKFGISTSACTFFAGQGYFRIIQAGIAAPYVFKTTDPTVQSNVNAFMAITPPPPLA
jgi:hypothetical protein